MSWNLLKAKLRSRPTVFRGGFYKKLTVISAAVIMLSAVFIFLTKQPSQNSDTPPFQDPADPIIMVWEHAAVTPDDPSTIWPMKAVQVVSPTWLRLIDESGTIEDSSDPAYIKWAKSHDYAIWVLVSNSFDPGLTASVLDDSEIRGRVAEELVSIAVGHGFEGINVDFENFSSSYRDQFTAFMHELSLLCEAEGLVLSVDVTMPSTSEYWSLGYDRSALAEIVDYVALMAYDEHWQASPSAGSVSSLPWMESGLQKVLEKVPAEKILLGIPFYTRLWEIDNYQSNPVILDSWSFSMHRAADIIIDNDAEIYWDETAGQHVARYHKNGLTYKMWLENEESVRRRLELVHTYDLAGIAAWRRGLETPDIWDLIEERLVLK